MGQEWENVLENIIEKLDYCGDRKKWREADKLKYLFGGGYTDLVWIGYDSRGRERKQG